MIRNQRSAAVALTILLACRYNGFAQETSSIWVPSIGTPQYFAVLVGDVDAAVKWYSTALGLQKESDSTAENGSWRIANLANEALAVEIIRDDRAKAVDRPMGSFKVGFRVPDQEEIADRVAVDTGERPRIVDFRSQRIRILQLKDPEGNTIQLTAPPLDYSTMAGATERFAFYSDPWINLHHFLYQWSREDEGLGKGRQHVPVPERSSVDSLSDADRDAWLFAVSFYRDSVAARDHFDDKMLSIKRDLQRLGGDPAATPPDYIHGIANALSTAMPVYLSRWWPRHDEANRTWVAEILPLLRPHEAEYVEMTTRVYGSVWPDEPIRVDVSAYANWAAGYTTFSHTVIYSTDPGNRGMYALETVLHEAQHTLAVGGRGREALYALFEKEGVEVPQNLWHALIFETAGEFVRSAAERDGLPEHTPYWIRENFEAFRGWKPVIPMVQKYWAPVVRGEAASGDAYARFLEEVQSAIKHP